MKRYINICTTLCGIVLCASCQRSIIPAEMNQSDKCITEHQWSNSLLSDFAYLQELMNSPEKWTEVGSGIAAKQECKIYQHQADPVKIWIDNERVILLRSECGIDNDRVLIQTSTVKKIDGEWIVKSVKLRKPSTDEIVVLESEQGNTLALTSAWTLP